MHAHAETMSLSFTTQFIWNDMFENDAGINFGFE